MMFALLLPACSQTSQTEVIDNAKIKLVSQGEAVTLKYPAVLKNDTVYVSLEDIADLPGLKIDFNAATGAITITGKDQSYELKTGEPFKLNDVNGPRPFLKDNLLYLPLEMTLNWIHYQVQSEKSRDGVYTFTVEKPWTDAQDQWKPLTDKELADVEAILAKGITISDPESDWAPIQEGLQPDGRKDNGQPYPISFTDIKSISFNADEKYLYIKITLYGIIPDEVTSWQNTQYNKKDFIQGIGCNIDLARFFNRNTGQWDQGLMQTGVSWVEGDPRENLINPKFVNPPIVGVSSFATNSGTKDKNNEDIYTMSSGEGRVGGGAGDDYFIGIFALKNFGLQLGDIIDIDISMEVGSILFHHECVDIILNNNTKTGDTIRWALGSNTYENLGPPKGALPLTKEE